MEVYVGTSGWLYDWNPRGSLDWYVRGSGLNAVELNASFYRIPYPSQVRGWSFKGRGLRWSVKVSRYITHYYKLSGRALELWERFREVFKQMDSLIDFYLLQLPPNFRRSDDNIVRLVDFARTVNLKWMLAIEFRHNTWFNSKTVELCNNIEATIVSIDSPLATWIARTGDTVYLRLHGKSGWYLYDYSEKELEELARRVVGENPVRAYVFFNNNHYMLKNARIMRKILEDIAGGRASL